MAPRPSQQLPLPPCPALFVTTDRERAPQGMGSDWNNLPGTAHIDRHHYCFNIYRLAPRGTGSDWKNLPGTAHIDKHYCFNI